MEQLELSNSHQTAVEMAETIASHLREMIPMADLPVLLHAIREYHDCTWADLAKRMDMNAGQLRQWADGTKSPSWNTVMPRLIKLGTPGFTVKKLRQNG